MAHEIAKLTLEHAGTFLERTEAIKVALSLGMPLHEIEAYLDWLDVVRGRNNGQQAPPKDRNDCPPEADGSPAAS